MMMLYVVFHARRINMPMNLNGTKHKYIITADLHMIICKDACILRSCGMLACEYNWVMISFVSMLRDDSMLIV
jgi:hypothetical protein